MGRKASNVLGAVSKSLSDLSGTAFGIAQMQEQTKQQQALLKQKQDALAVKQQGAQVQRNIAISNRFDNLIDRGLTLSDPSDRKAYFELHNDELLQLSDQGDRTWNQQKRKFYTSSGEGIRNAFRSWTSLVNQGRAAIVQGRPFDVDPKRVTESFDAYAAIAPKDDLQIARKERDMMFQALQQQTKRRRDVSGVQRAVEDVRTPEELAAKTQTGQTGVGVTPEGKTKLGIPASGQRAGRGEPGLIKALGTAQGKTFAKQLDSQVTAKNQITNLDNALAIIDKVETGPLAGRNIPFLLQKIGREDAQALELFLQKENVGLIMKFAKEAGARAIDTEAEQRRLFQAIANKEMDAPILRKALISMKATSLEGTQIVDEKQAWLEAGNTSFARFRPSTLKKKAYVTPDGQIGFFGKDEAKPEGAMTLTEMWRSKDAFREGGAVPTSTPGGFKPVFR
jgi:hypothetical protein